MKAIAVYTLCNNAGLEILEINDYEETVKVRPVVADNPEFGAIETCSMKTLWPGDEDYDEDLSETLGEEVIFGFMWGEMFIPFAECVKCS